MGFDPIQTTDGIQGKRKGSTLEKEMATRNVPGRQRRLTEKAKEAQQQEIDADDAIEVTTTSKDKTSATDPIAIIMALLMEVKAELTETKRQVADQATALQALMTVVQELSTNAQIPSRGSPWFGAVARTPPPPPQIAALATFPPRRLHLRCHPE